VRPSKSGRDALCAALAMARAGGGLVSVAQVARDHGIPETTLAKVFQQLVRAGLAQGTRGVGGGYRLARPASAVTVLDVIAAFQPPESIGGGHDCQGGAEEDRLRALFGEVDEMVRATFESVTLATLVRSPSRKAS